MSVSGLDVRMGRHLKSEWKVGQSKGRHLSGEVDYWGK